jgi:hypothetical protein
MRATSYQRIGASLVVGIFIVLTLSACGGGGDEAVDEQTAAAPGDDGSPAPGGDGDGEGSGAGSCSAAGGPGAARRGLSDAERRALVASCNGLPPGFIDIDINFRPPPLVPASGAKK